MLAGIVPLCIPCALAVRPLHRFVPQHPRFSIMRTLGLLGIALTVNGVTLKFGMDIDSRCLT